jgi:hypothetical protein
MDVAAPLPEIQLNPISARKREANRRNAQRSTGPKTERGKRTVARNAIKHGFLARQVVITAGDGEESLEEFHTLLGQLCECYEPIGVVEESLVQTIANCWWRKARVIRAENGEIRKRLDTLAMDRALRNSEKENRDVAVWSSMHLLFFSVENEADRPELTRDGMSHLREAQRDLHKHQFGLSYLTELLQVAKSEIARDGYISADIKKRISPAFHYWDYAVAVACCYCDPPEAKMEDRPSETLADAQAYKKRTDLVVSIIDNCLERLSELDRHATERDRLATDAEARSFSLPPAEATDKLLRYEAHVDRQLYRAMDQLERLQRQRRGENVPPPLNINLGRRR